MAFDAPNPGREQMGGGSPRIRVYIASSLDGFIAGPGDELSWLPEPGDGWAGDEGALDFYTFLDQVGALLMGRRTYDVVRGFDVEWPYGDRPVLVASHRELDHGAPGPVRRVEGPIESLVAEARTAAGERDVYIDGGALIRQACAADLVDEVNLFLAPTALGAGHPLFAGLEAPYALHMVGVHRAPGGMVHLRMEPRR